MSSGISRLVKALLLCQLLFLFTIAQAQDATNPTNALQHYLKNGDNTFKWELKETFSVGDVTAYALLLTSQKWREHTWTHELTIMVPKEIKYDGALLFITGGSVKDGLPNWSGKGEKMLPSLSAVAQKNSAIVALIKQVPNQPLYGGLTEDALISYTLHNFKKDGDHTWPLLFPMVKSAVKGMDAIQEFARQKLNHQISRFVISGASKRGWTTWLTGANDTRVSAIGPMVIDILNMPVSLDYQIRTWGEYSIQIEDYVKLGIPQTASTPGGAAITQMVDPYSYRKTLTMPKMIFMGTNDEYWVVDNIKNYYDSIPGQNLIHYVPNAGHDLGGGKQAIEALGSFFGNTLQNNPYPICTWEAVQKKDGVNVTVKATAKKLVDVIVWSADSKDKDFRDEKWGSKSLGIKKKKKFSYTQPFPQDGYRAFYLDLKYEDPNGGTFTESTRMFVTDTEEVFLK